MTLSWNGFYAIIDIGVLGDKDPITATRALLRAGPVALQLRAKSLSARDFLHIARQLAPLCQEASVPFVVNDRADVALLSGAWGVHLGQDDLPLSAARSAFPSLKIGVSTHHLGQLQSALAQGADYVGFGPVFSTSTKENPDPMVGVALLAEAIQLATQTPVVAIGGITRAHLPELLKASARVVTSISDVLRAPDITTAALAFHHGLTRR
jgi:thiamine-phosphate pyrophosphorylase